MNLLIDGRPIRTPLSGSAKFIVELHRQLSKCDYSHSVYMQSRTKDASYGDLIEQNSRIEYFGNVRMRNVLWELIPALTKEKYCFELLHETYFAQLNYKFNRKVTTVHDLIPLDYPDWFNKRLSSVVRKNFKRQTITSSTMVFSSKFTESRAKAHGFSGNSTVIHLAARQVRFDKCDRSSLSKIDAKLLTSDYVTILGNIEPRKSHYELAQAVDYINRVHEREVILVIVGSGVHKSSEITKKIIDLLGEKVVFTGFVDEKLKDTILRFTACHAYVSKFEGFGLPVVESIINDIPSVFYDATSVSELIPHRQFSVTSLETKELSRRILENFHLRPSEVMTRSEVDAFRLNYSWERVAEQYVEVYNRA